MSQNGQADRNLEITFELGGPNKGQRFTLPIPTYNLWVLYQALDRAGTDGSLALAKTAGIVASLIRRQNLPDPDHALNSVWLGLADLLNVETDALAEEEEEEPADEDQVLNFCYVLLKHRRITREESSRIATALLKQHLDTDAWRKRVDRWVQSRGLEKIKHTKRRQRKRP
jgi:hypothetical protein